MTSFSMYMGTADDGKHWLGLIDMDDPSGHFYGLAVFESEVHKGLFAKFMESKGYQTLTMPNQETLDKFFE